MDTEEAMVEGDELTNTTEPSLGTAGEEAMVDEGANASEPSVMRSISADFDQGDQPAECDQDDPQVDYDQDDQRADCDQEDQPSGCDQVNTDYRTSSTVDRLDQTLTHHDSTSSSDHEDTPTEHDNTTVNDDTHPDVTDHVIQEDHMAEETFHNSVDELFNDISVDELFEDV